MKGHDDRNRGKFAEPRSWAANWCGYGLTAGRSRTQARGRGSRGFAEPRGWSVGWCNEGLQSKPHAGR